MSFREKIDAGAHHTARWTSPPKNYAELEEFSQDMAKRYPGTKASSYLTMQPVSYNKLEAYAKEMSRWNQHRFKALTEEEIFAERRAEGLPWHKSIVEANDKRATERNKAKGVEDGWAKAPKMADPKPQSIGRHDRSMTELYALEQAKCEKEVVQTYKSVIDHNRMTQLEPEELRAEAMAFGTDKHADIVRKNDALMGQRHREYEKAWGEKYPTYNPPSQDALDMKAAIEAQAVFRDVNPFTTRPYAQSPEHQAYMKAEQEKNPERYAKLTPAEVLREFKHRDYPTYVTMVAINDQAIARREQATQRQTQTDGAGGGIERLAGAAKSVVQGVAGFAERAKSLFEDFKKITAHLPLTQAHVAQDAPQPLRQRDRTG